MIGMNGFPEISRNAVYLSILFPYFGDMSWLNLRFDKSILFGFVSFLTAGIQRSATEEGWSELLNEEHIGELFVGILLRGYGNRIRRVQQDQLPHFIHYMYQNSHPGEAVAFICNWLQDFQTAESKSIMVTTAVNDARSYLGKEALT